MTWQPAIGITTYGREERRQFYVPDEYVDAVRWAGGVPLLLPAGESNMDAILRAVDGIIFAGGGDIDPARYGGASHPTIARIDSERDDFELKLAKHALRAAKPVLGICRGLQILSVASGGDLVAHVPEVYGEEIRHKGEDNQSAEHKVQVEPGSRLAKITGKNQIVVKSKHHQALKSIPDAWRVTARARDGVVEALEHREHPWMTAVLWHPELSPEDPDHQSLFKALVEEAGRAK